MAIEFPERFDPIELSDPALELGHLRNLTFHSPALKGRGDVSLYVPPQWLRSPMCHSSFFYTASMAATGHGLRKALLTSPRSTSSETVPFAPC
jgi:hypothetical protein